MSQTTIDSHPESTGEAILQTLSHAGEFIAETATSAKDTIVNKVYEASEFIQTSIADTAYEYHQSEANDPNAAPGERMAARAYMQADALEAAHHKGEAEYHKTLADNRAQVTSVQIQQGMNSLGESLAHTGDYISQTASEATTAAGETLSNAGHFIAETASNAGEYLSQTAQNAKTIANEKARIASRELKQGIDAAGETLANAGDYISQTASEATSVAGETLSNAGNYIAETASHAKVVIENTASETAEYLSETATNAKIAIENTTNETAEYLSETATNAKVAIESTTNEAAELLLGEKALVFEEKAQQASEWAQGKKADVVYDWHKVQAENTNLPIADRLEARVKMQEDALESAQHKTASAQHKEAAANAEINQGGYVSLGTETLPLPPSSPRAQLS